MSIALQRSWQTVVIATVFLLCPIRGGAQDIGRLLPDQIAGEDRRVDLPQGGMAGDSSGDGEVLIESLRGVELLGEITVPHERRLRAGLEGGLGDPLTTGGLLGLMDQVIAHYQQHDYPVVEVFLPEQEITDGRIQLEVEEGIVGEVAMAGGEHLGVRRFGVRPGDKLTMAELQGALDWLNRNRFHDARLVVAPGDEIAEANLLFQLSDERPFRVFSGFENSGVEVVGEERFFSGFEWGNAFGLGHRMIYQATLGTDVDAFRAHALDYRIPLVWEHELNLLAALVESEISLKDGTETGGSSWLLGAHYSVPLKRRGDWRHELSVGFDFKSTDNNLEFGGVEVFATRSELVHLVGRYSASLDRPRHRTSLLGEMIYSPGDLSEANSDEAFRGIRRDAVSEYSYLRGQIQHARRVIGDISLIVRAGGQWTDAALLPSEQLALGGHDRVRGYAEREALGDRGYWGSTELRAPVFHDDLQLLGFLDYGRSEMESGQGDREFLSAGPGLRYRFKERASFRFDYGWQLDGGGSHAHFGMQLEF
ncbi:MAG: hemolysin activation/secretion protein [Pseudoalteromonas tetraodonis]